MPRSVLINNIQANITNPCCSSEKAASRQCHMPATSPKNRTHMGKLSAGIGNPGHEDLNVVTKSLRVSVVGLHIETHFILYFSLHIV